MRKPGIRHSELSYGWDLPELEFKTRFLQDKMALDGNYEVQSLLVPPGAFMT
jgi:hypothetical protein